MTDILDAAKAEAISEKTLRRAKKELRKCQTRRAR
jgi:hypothetical protein